MNHLHPHSYLSVCLWAALPSTQGAPVSYGPVHNVAQVHAAWWAPCASHFPAGFICTSFSIAPGLLETQSLAWLPFLLWSNDFNLICNHVYFLPQFISLWILGIMTGVSLTSLSPWRLQNPLCLSVPFLHGFPICKPRIWGGAPSIGLHRIFLHLHQRTQATWSPLYHLREPLRWSDKVSFSY